MEAKHGPLNENEAIDAVIGRLYNRSLPRFRNMIEQGRVRVTFLDHTKVRVTLQRQSFFAVVHRPRFLLLIVLYLP